MCQKLLSKFLSVPVDSTPAGVCSQPSTAVCITCVKVGPCFPFMSPSQHGWCPPRPRVSWVSSRCGVSIAEKEILISNLPCSSPRSALQLLGAHGANVRWVGGGQGTPSPVRESTWKFSPRKPQTFHCIWERETEKGEQESRVPVLGESSQQLWGRLSRTLHDGSFALGLLSPAVIQEAQSPNKQGFNWIVTKASTRIFPFLLPKDLSSLYF